MNHGLGKAVIGSKIEIYGELRERIIAKEHISQEYLVTTAMRIDGALWTLKIQNESFLKKCHNTKIRSR